MRLPSPLVAYRHWREVLRDMLWWTPIVLGAIIVSHLVT
jgi:hypothetical protein